MKEIDFVFIDGHHEKIATIHYFLRVSANLAQGAVVVFDDISWSQDMRDAWNELAADDRFSHAVDLGRIGVCIWNKSSTATRYWDMQDVVGRAPIGNPRGWQA